VSGTNIYVLEDPRNGSPFYVGKANNPNRRVCWGYTNLKVSTRIKDIQNAGFNLVPIILENIPLVVSKSDWVPREKHWIKFYRLQGSNLLNENEGGGGPTTHTAEVREQLAALHRGRVWPEPTRRAVSAGVSRYWKTVPRPSVPTRQCPSCIKQLTYKFLHNRKQAEERKALCRSCAAIKRMGGSL
jgi:hypothetical protein